MGALATARFVVLYPLQLCVAVAELLQYASFLAVEDCNLRSNLVSYSQQTRSYEVMNMQLHLDPTQTGHALGDLFGIFFEDLNHAADGGLYAELLENRDFAYDKIDRATYHPLYAWAPIGNAQLSVTEENPPFLRNPRQVTVEPRAGTGISNGESYTLVLWAKAETPMGITAQLAESSAHFVLSSKWTRYEAVLHPQITTDNARLCLTLDAPGAFTLTFASLFPGNTYMGRPGGLRQDIAQALCDLHPR